MYTYKYAIGRYRNYQPGFHIVDISTIAVKNLLKYFTILDIVLYDEIYNRKVTITLDDYASEFVNDDRNINQYLEDNGNNTLEYSLEVLNNEYVYAKWESLSHKGFYPHPANINLSNDRQEKLTSQAAPDVRLLRDNYTYSEYKKLAAYALYVVNGCFVKAEGNTTGLYLRNVGKDFQHIKKDLYVSAINMEKIGKVESISITKEMVRYDGDKTGSRFFIDLSKSTNLEDKTVWVVFNGQLLVDEDIVNKANKNTLYLDTSNIDLMSHHTTYSQYTRTPKWTDQSKQYNYVLDCLTADNSFVILIDNPTVGVEISPMVKFAYPINHQTEEKFNHPVMLENGLFPYCFRRTYGNEARIVNTDIGHAYLPVIDTVGDMSDNLVYTAANKGQAGFLPRAYLFKITGIGK